MYRRPRSLEDPQGLSHSRKAGGAEPTLPWMKWTSTDYYAPSWRPGQRRTCSNRRWHDGLRFAIGDRVKFGVRPPLVPRRRGVPFFSESCRRAVCICACRIDHQPLRRRAFADKLLRLSRGPEGSRRAAGDEVALGLNLLAIAAWAERKRWAEPGEQEACTFCSLGRIASFEFSASCSCVDLARGVLRDRVLVLRVHRLRTQDGSLYVTSTCGAAPCFFKSFAHELQRGRPIPVRLHEHVQDLVTVPYRIPPANSVPQPFGRWSWVRQRGMLRQELIKPFSK